MALQVSLRAQESATDRPLVVPEPGSLALFGLAFVARVGSRGRRRLPAS